jgi:D-3-phosphoglycerate dehydrogenase / 2-oxoglutarate reductase
VAAALHPAHPVRVLLLENVSPTALEVFGADGFQVETVTQALSPEALIKTLGGGTVDVLGIRSKTRVPAEVLAQAPSLLAIGCFCIGTDQVDLESANRRGIPVFNAPFSNTRSVAELMIGEIISLSRQLGDRTREVAAGTWKKVAAGCYEVRGKTLGIVGYGHIGRQLGVLAEGLGMRVFFHDHTPKLPMGNNVAVPTLRALLAMADFVSLHVPDTAQTRNMMGAAEFAAMRKGSYLLNASRGTVVVIPALAAALQSGHLAGAAVDVYPEEPETSGDGFRTTLQGLPNVLLTPHIGGSTSEAQAAIGREVSTVLGKFVRTGATRGAVNFPNVEPQAQQGARRIMNVHRNVPGVLRDINKIVSDLQANIRSQVLATDPEIGYLIMDIDQDAQAVNAVSGEVHRRIAALPTSIRTRTV